MRVGEARGWGGGPKGAPRNATCCSHVHPSSGIERYVLMEMLERFRGPRHYIGALYAAERFSMSRSELELFLLELLNVSHVTNFMLHY